jgi:mannosyltransferase
MKFVHNHKWKSFVFIVLCIGIGFRVDAIGRKSLSREEAMAVALASKPYWAMIDQLKGSPLPPLYYSLLHGWVGLAGLGDATVRLPALIFGILALPTTYFAWRPLVGRRASSWAVALVSLNAFHIWYSNDTKMYSLIWLLATLSSAAFLRTVLGRPEWSAWHVVYGASTACLPFVSYVGIAPLVVQSIYGAGLMWIDRSRCRSVLKSGLVGFAALVPFGLWLPFALRAAVHRTEIRWIPAADWHHALEDLYQLFGALLLGYKTSGGMHPPGLWWDALNGSFHLCILVACMLLAIFFVRSRPEAYGRKPSRRASASDVENHRSYVQLRPVSVYLVLWLVLPIIETLVFSLCIYSLWGVPRYFAAAAPALLLLLAQALGSFRSRPIYLILGGVLLAGNLLAIAFDRAHITRVPMREIARSIQGFATTLQTLRGTQQTLSNNAQMDIPVKLLWWEDKVAIEALLHASEQASPGIRITAFDYDSIVQEKRSFFLLSRYGTDPGNAGTEGDFAPDFISGYKPCRISSDMVYQDRYSTTPSPFNETRLELFVYYPIEQIPTSRR